MNDHARNALRALPASERIAEDYQRYLRSLLQIQDDEIRDAIHRELETEALVKGPYLEATPAYRRGASPQDLIDEGVLPRAFAEFGSDALPMERRLYAHQEASLRKAREGRNLVVATGTGSGKTESFLVPILAHLAEERERGTLGAGVRALLLYPMNALANDQVKRLREVLRDTPWVTFGRYTGQTKETAEAAKDAFGAQFPGETPIPNELLSREEMRQNPPHLLLTNYAMLEYLLLRPQDLTLFDPANDTWRFVIVDEAHVYDGAQGTEVGMLLRRLRQRVGAQRLQAIATSATVGSESEAADVTQFAQNLFDLPFEWKAGDATRQDVVMASRVDPPASEWEAAADSSFAAWAEAPRDEQVVADEPFDDDWGVPEPTNTDATAEELVQAAAGEQAHENAAQTLAREGHLHRLREALAAGPQSVGGLARALMGDRTEPEAELAGLVDLAAGLRDEQGNPVLSARYHLWANAVDRAFVCLYPEHHHGYLKPRNSCERCAAEGRNDVPIWLFATCQQCRTGYVLPQTSEPGQPRRWLALVDQVVAADEDDFDATPDTDVETVWLCPGCGDKEAHDGPCPRCGLARRLVAVEPERDEQNQDSVTTPPYRCLGCGTGREGLIRGMSVGSAGTTAVLTTSTYQELPDEDPALSGAGRKLLTFSDSRQQAAYFAPYLETSYTRFLWRSLILTAIQELHEQVERAVTFQEVQGRTLSLAEAANLMPHLQTALQKEAHVAGWLLAELAGTDERNSLEGTGLIEVTYDHGGAALPMGLANTRLPQDEQWTIIDTLLTSVRRRGAIQNPSGLDISPIHPAYEFRPPTLTIRGDGPEPKLRILAWRPRTGANGRSDYLSRVLQAQRLTDMPVNEFLTGLWNWLTKANGDTFLATVNNRQEGPTRAVSLESIRLSPASGQEQCDRCGRWAPDSAAGVCLNMRCSGTMTPRALPDPKTDDNHYRHLYRSMHPAALIAREHTAQWTSEEAASIQEQFIKGQVNLLSCSTTFELGVDVGELQSTLLRNVPPTTANYVQRAGRAGRRGRAAALVVTHARSRPHDAVMFDDPRRMISGAIRAPYIPTDNERIARRHLHSIAFSAFFRHAYESRGLTWTTMDQFFSADRSPNGPELLADYLRHIPGEVSSAALDALPEVLHDELGLDTGQWAVELVARVKEEAEDYQTQIATLDEKSLEAAAKGKSNRAFVHLKNTISNRRLLDRLAVRNILPKYGFPVDVVALDTSNIPALSRNLELDRDLALALSEYAPGSQIVAGGKVVRSAGIRLRPGKDALQPYIGTCKGPDQHFIYELHDPVSECPAPLSDGQPGTCGAAIQMRQAIVPEFGFVADAESLRIGNEPPKPTWTSQAKTIRLSSDPQHRTLTTNEGPVHVEWGKRAEFAIVAEGERGQGWYLCQSCGRGIPRARTSRPPEKHKRPWDESPCHGTFRTLRMVHTFETDAVAITMPGGPPGNDDSALAGLMAGASDALEIPLDDIGGTTMRAGGRTRLVIYDTVPAGAGNAIRIGERLESIAAAAMQRVTNCTCGIDSSCYACLRHYRNQSVHEELARQDAIRRIEPLVDAVPLAPQPAPEPLPVPGAATYPAGWESVFELADPAERALLSALAERELPRPEVGVESGGGLPLSIAWPEHRIAVDGGFSAEDIQELQAEGWTLVAADVDAIMQALEGAARVDEV